MRYPTGAINLCLDLVSKAGWRVFGDSTTYPEPPVAFPYVGDNLPKLVVIAKPSIQNPLRTIKPVIYSPLRVSRSMMSALMNERLRVTYQG